MISCVEVALPSGWQESVVARHVASPYSPQALAEPRKDWLELAPFDVSDLPIPQPTPFPLRPIKQAGEEFDPAEQPSEYTEAHLIFVGAAKLILGSAYPGSRIFFDHFSAHLYPGQVHTFAQPHMDGTMPGGVNSDQFASTGFYDLELKLVGTVMNDVPTQVLQGATEASDFEGETLTHLKREAELNKNFGIEELPLNTIVILAPSTVHCAQPAPHEVTRRHFLRWQAFA